MLITTIYTLSACAIMYVFEGEALRIFTQIHYAHVMLDTIIPAYLALVLMYSLVGTIRGEGKTMVTMILSILSLCIVRVFWIFTILRISPSIEGVLLGYPIS